MTDSSGPTCPRTGRQRGRPRGHPARAGALALLALLAPTVASAECAFDKMLKVVVREVTPGVSTTSFAGQPKTLYRVGTRFARTEEALDAETGIHALIVVSEPDSWIIDLAKKTGRHVIAGAPFHFHAPIVWTEGLPESLRGLEFGCELAYMQAHSPDPPEPREVEGNKVLAYEMRADPYRVALFVGRKDKKPRAIVVSKGTDVVYGLRYDSWEVGLTPDLKLFRPPEGIALEEAK